MQPEPTVADAERVDILVVCTANLCRSPMIELLLARRIERLALPWRVASAGTHARPGLPMHPPTARALAPFGIEPHDWRTHRVTAELVAAADVVLAAHSDNRRALITAHPEALSRTFLLKEFVRLVGATEVRGWDASVTITDLVSAARSARATMPVPKAGSEDIADPMGRRQRAFDRCAREVADTVGGLFAAIGRPVSG